MRARRSNLMGTFLIACGMIYLMLAVGSTLYPLATLSFGPIEVKGLSEFSAINAFIGLVFIAMGVTINSRRRPW